ncbi:MAG TPA: hypothetical protein PKA62_08095, partial [Thermoanaerobaculia bacterium]|nr:hypothetical protein [Thermoanaerobaculia bacterium]
MNASRAVVLALAGALLAPPASAEKQKPRAVLVEADGDEEALSAFVARLESELSDRGKVTLSDARLAGISLGAVVAEPDGEAARVLRAEWAGTSWIGVSLAPCRVDVSRMTYRDTSSEGYAYDRVVESVRVDCPATLRIVDAATGKEKKPLEVTGTANYRRSGPDDDE